MRLITWKRNLPAPKNTTTATRLEPRLDQIKADLFPKDSLQERTENFGLFYVKWGQTFIDELIYQFPAAGF
jgi:hypothetical protein